jgi:hypothetical protein
MGLVRLGCISNSLWHRQGFGFDVFLGGGGQQQLDTVYKGVFQDVILNTALEGLHLPWLHWQQPAQGRAAGEGRGRIQQQACVSITIASLRPAVPGAPCLPRLHREWLAQRACV